MNALTDGLFGVAMTLLVIDVRFPADVDPHDQRELIAALEGSWKRFFPYLISFFVLGSRWLASVEISDAAVSNFVDTRNAMWWLAYLLFITLDPLTTTVIGRYPNQAPAVWLYAGNTMLIAAISWRMMSFIPDAAWTRPLRDRRVALAGLFLSSLAAIVISFFSANVAPWAMVVNVVTAFPLRIRRRRRLEERTA